MSLVTLRKCYALRAAVAAMSAAAFAAPAAAQNITVPDANVLSLLSPFLQLPNTAAGQATLTSNISAAIATNNAAANSAVIEAVSISDKTIFGTPNGAGVYATIVLPSGSHTPPSGSLAGLSTVTAYGPGANLGGGLPQQNIQDGSVNGKPTGTVVAGTVTPYQQYGGYGQLGSAFQAAVQVNGASQIPSLVSLLTNAYAFNSSALGIAKFYFANGTTSGSVPVVAPAGYNLSTVSGGSNSTYDSYYLSHGYSYNANLGPNQFGDTRPVQFTSNSGPSINVYDPQAIINLTTNPAFPSGHTTYAFTDSILLGMIAPQYFQSMLLRGSEYANSRIGLGVHYPLDIIASRSFVQYDLAQLLNATSGSAYYNTNSIGSTTALNLNGTFVTAAAQFNSYLSSYVAANSATLGCTSVGNCAASNVYNTYSAQTYSYQGATNAAIYEYRQNYGLPTLSFTAAPRELADTQGNTAAILLATLYGGQGNPQAQALANAVTGGTSGAGIYGNLSTSTINQIIANTETQALAAFYGTQLSYWSRIDLYDAAGYFQNVTGKLTLASTDQVNVNVTVGNGGVFGGSGTVNGSVTFQAGGALGAQGNGAAESSSFKGLTATSANFNTGSKVELSGVFLPGEKYTLLSTTGGAQSITLNSAQTSNGTISPSIVSLDTTSLTNGNLMQLLTGSLAIVGDPTVVVVLTANFAAAAKTPNQTSVANAIDAVANTGAYSANGATFLANLIANNTVTTAPAAFDLLGGEGITGQQQTALNAGSLFVTTVLGQATYWGDDRSNDIFGLKDAPACSLKDGYDCALSHRARFWAAGFGGYAELDGQSGTGSAGLQSHNAGVATGADYEVTRNLIVGIAGGYSDSTYSISDRSASGTVEGGHFGVYGRENLGSFYVAGAVEYAHYNNTTGRFVSALGGLEEEKGRFTSDEWLARFEGGYKYGTFSGLNVTPFAGFQVASLNNGAFTEFSTGVAGLQVASKSIDSDKTFLGVQLDTKLTTPQGLVISPYVRLSWEHEFNTGRSLDASFAALPGASFTVFGASAPSDLARLNTGFKVDITPSIALFASFDGEFSDRADAYAGTGGLKIRF